MELRGWISEFSEQGMEGEVWRIFQDEAHSDSDSHGWRFEGMHRLADGDELTILNAEGSTVWQGLLQNQTRWFGFAKSTTPVEPEWHPVDVPLQIWKGWFQARPPMRAILKPLETPSVKS